MHDKRTYHAFTVYRRIPCRDKRNARLEGLAREEKKGIILF